MAPATYLNRWAVANARSLERAMIVEMVRATGAVPEDEVQAVAAALMDAGYTNTATLADLEAAELRQVRDLTDSLKRRYAIVVRLRGCLLPPTDLPLRIFALVMQFI